MLQPGTIAPAFSLYASPTTEISLDSYRGKRVVLVFYPADWSPVCGDQLVLYNEIIDLFKSLNTELIGISVDGKWCHASFSEVRNLGFPLLADFEPKGETARSYGVYNEYIGECERALFLLDENGIIRWRFLSDPAINPGAEGILQAIENLEKNVNA
jgi:peroxiredoxin